MTPSATYARDSWPADPYDPDPNCTSPTHPAPATPSPGYTLTPPLSVFQTYNQTSYTYQSEEPSALYPYTTPSPPIQPPPYHDSPFSTAGQPPFAPSTPDHSLGDRLRHSLLALSAFPMNKSDSGGASSDESQGAPYTEALWGSLGERGDPKTTTAGTIFKPKPKPKPRLTDWIP